MRAHAAFDDFPPKVAAQKKMRLDEYLRQHDPALKVMKHFAAFYRGLNSGEFTHESERVSHGFRGRFGADLVVFLPGGGRVLVDLRFDQNLRPLHGEFTVRALDIHSGRIVRLPDLKAGSRHTIDTGMASDVSIRLDAK
jgi:hypothetical protein